MVITYYRVSGGPIIKTSQRKISFSSIKPAENPSTGFLFSSETIRIQQIWYNYTFCYKHVKKLNSVEKQGRTL